MSYSTGQILKDRYRIESLVGSGAFGEVYLATHLELHAPRALKVLRKDSPGIGSSEYNDIEERFRLEAALGAKLDHPNLVRVYDFEHDEQSLILAMEYCPGGSLADRLYQAREAGRLLPLGEVIQIGMQVAQGLAELHKLDVVHRDLKPSNILFDKQWQAKVADFGVAQTPGGLSMRSLLGSLTPAHPGTPGFMSPEQENTTAYLKPPSDVYSLGVVLFICLTGRNPHNLRPGTAPASLRAEVPAWLDGLIVRMLAEDPKQRPWDAVEVVERLNEGLHAKERNEQEEHARKQVEKPPVRKEMSIKLALGVEMIFVRVPAGEFWMGSDEKDAGALDDEKPLHAVYLDEYWIGKYPVTNQQFQLFIQKSGWRNDWSSDYSFDRGYEQHPAMMVTWKDAVGFCAWVSKISGEKIRLPTEAEWEKAARGTDRRIYPWGSQPPDERRANFDQKFNVTTPVGKFSPQGDSPYGCADMAGNVWEWVADWYDWTYYQNSPKNNPAGPKSGEYRVVRGGSCFNDTGFLRSASRYWCLPGFMNIDYCFRCAR